MVHHGDRGSQYLSIRYTERLAEAGIEQSVGSVGDSYDNALAESIIGLYKTEVIRNRGPGRDWSPFNLRTRRWGRHKGTSAHECLTGQRVHDWLTLLGYPPSPTLH